MGFNRNLNIIAYTMRGSMDALLLLLFLLFIVSMLFGSAMYFVEQSGAEWDVKRRRWLRDGNPTGFQSIPDSLYFILVTVTTVGYGDVYPKTELGKVLTCLAMLAGLLVIAFPLLIMSSIHEEAIKLFKQFQREQLHARHREMLRVKTSEGRRKSSLWAAIHHSGKLSLSMSSENSFLDYLSSPLLKTGAAQEMQAHNPNAPAVHFQNVSFPLPEPGLMAGAVTSVEALSFSIPRKATVGLLGSRLLLSRIPQLLTGHLPPNAGVVAVNGINPQGSRSTEELVHHLRVPAFDQMVGNRSLGAYLTGQNTVEDEERVREALRETGAQEAISLLPSGLETPLESLSFLTRGQSCLLALTRAHLHDPAVLCVDVEFLSYSTDCAVQIITGTQSLMNDRSTIVLATHYHQVFERTLWVLVFDEEGSVAEIDSHTVLLVSEGLYHQYYQDASQAATLWILGRDLPRRSQHRTTRARTLAPNSSFSPSADPSPPSHPPTDEP
eukprot:NODE_570_length_1602_cov_42.629105_g469_i0.p1 GENE.NODE_570_length_1602_cov_42.629105_g469_i0~~NODE_570_length_1602_cov_42.629105_g469_i0.p1  ORF type:complete len:504 (-),score=178.86 NODE_570_length_1602_cov_42.629105_g469_i0:90-1577(-)